MELLIDEARLHDWRPDENLRILDVRYSLQDATAGEELFRHAHIPGAQYVNTCQDLSGPVIKGETGRHPLPNAQAFIATLQNWGITSDSRIVLYDDGSHFFVPRLWWMLSQWMGLEQVYILHGGFKAWESAGLPTTAELSSFTRGELIPQINDEVIVVADQLLAFVDAGGVLLDARSEERFRGDVEPLDAKAGHIPGAESLSCARTTDEQGYFLPAEQLVQLFSPWSGRETACYCGSGISACQSILAMVLAGLPLPKLYPGSWSEWITDPLRPIAIGTAGTVRA